MKNILVLSDFSETARNALKYALSCLQAAESECHIFLLNTYLIPPATTDQLVRLNDELRGQSLKKLQSEMRIAEEEVAKQHKTKGGAIDFEIVSHMGSLKNVIGYITTEKKIHCLVAGDHKNFNIRTLQEALCPVLIVPPHASYSRIKNIVVTQNATPAPDIKSLWPWKAIANEANVHVTTKTSVEDLHDVVAQTGADLLIWRQGNWPFLSLPVPTVFFANPSP